MNCDLTWLRPLQLSHTTRKSYRKQNHDSWLAPTASEWTARPIAWRQPFPQQPDQAGNYPERNQKQDNDDHITLLPSYLTVSPENRFSDAAHRAQDLAATH